MQAVPNVVTLDLSEFPIERDEVDGYTVLKLPQNLRDVFDQGGAHLVWIPSAELARNIPDFGGKTSGEQHSLCFHQDHINPEDPRQFLMLTKHGQSARGSSTLVILPEIAERVLAVEEKHFNDAPSRTRMGRERSYDSRFLISEEEYDRCFDEDGYEKVVTDLMARRGVRDELCVRLGILGYLVRGPYADHLMEKTMEVIGDELFSTSWEEEGVLILHNPRLFHGRVGGNTTPLQRNFCI